MPHPALCQRRLRRGAPRRTAAALFVALAVGAGAGGCVHATGNFAQELAQVAYPDWVLRGSGPARAAQTRCFFGVGQVAGMRNAALARSTADNRARGELGRAFELFAASVLAAWVTEQDTQAGRAGAGASTGTELGPRGGVTLVAQPAELGSEQLVKVLAAVALPSVQVIEHWTHPDDGAIFSLARLELDQLTDGIDRARELSPQLRSWLQQHLAAQHDVLAEEKLRRDALLTGRVPTTP